MTEPSSDILAVSWPSKSCKIAYLMPLSTILSSRKSGRRPCCEPDRDLFNMLLSSAVACVVGLVTSRNKHEQKQKFTLKGSFVRSGPVVSLVHWSGRKLARTNRPGSRPDTSVSTRRSRLKQLDCDQKGRELAVNWSQTRTNLSKPGRKTKCHDVRLPGQASRSLTTARQSLTSQQHTIFAPPAAVFLSYRRAYYGCPNQRSDGSQVKSTINL